MDKDTMDKDHIDNDLLIPDFFLDHSYFRGQEKFENLTVDKDAMDKDDIDKDLLIPDFFLDHSYFRGQEKFENLTVDKDAMDKDDIDKDLLIPDFFLDHSYFRGLDYAFDPELTDKILAEASEIYDEFTNESQQDDVTKGLVRVIPLTKTQNKTFKEKSIAQLKKGYAEWKVDCNDSYWKEVSSLC